ncbi:MAG: uL15 family ribosomal protein [Candidatus Sungbacteria bacterium]|uniref:Large ribosomal subunit protein uL15 n=1 Tax=Candidatus Sungiibacteriota bacterium TaxID=2750080 RepID=A0A933DSV5_9BACT|nr:uL15 family ribosomal protein [Candidatus Sungbacteria bacterium]
MRPNTRRRRERRVGRGGKRGTTAGRGTKGQKSRAGAKIRPAIRDIMKKLPKQRGYRFRSFQPRPAVVDLARVAARFPDGATIDPAALLASGMIRRIKGKLPVVKILGNAAAKKRLHLKGVSVSAAVRQRIHEAGGTIRPVTATAVDSANDERSALRRQSTSVGSSNRRGL